MEFLFSEDTIGSRDHLEAALLRYKELVRNRQDAVKILFEHCNAYGQRELSKDFSVKVAVNQNTYWLRSKEEISFFLSKIEQVDVRIKQTQKFIIACHIEIDAPLNNNQLTVAARNANLLSRIKDAMLTIISQEKRALYVISEVLQTTGNLIARTIDGKCLKKFSDIDCFQQELRILLNNQHLEFMPTIIDYSEKDHWIVTPYYKKVSEEALGDLSVKLSAVLQEMKRVSLRHNDLYLFNEVFHDEGTIKIIDWEHATQGDDPLTKPRVFDDNCVIDVYRLLQSGELTEFWPHLFVSRTLISEQEKGGDYFNAISYYLEHDDIRKFGELGNFLEGLADYRSTETPRVAVALLFTKGKLEFDDVMYHSDDLADIKRFIDLQSNSASDTLSHFWSVWWQRYFQSDEENPIFQHRRAGIFIRNEMLHSAFEDVPRDKAVLDIGSNAGIVAEYISSLGHPVYGFEPDRSVWEIAVAKELPNCRFFNSEFYDAQVSGINFGAAVLLSVFHRVWAIKGEHAAKELLLAMSERVDTIVFEGSAHRSRYGACPPSFRSNDLGDCIRWHRDLFRSVLPSWDANFRGNTPHTSREPYRPFFHLSKNT